MKYLQFQSKIHRKFLLLLVTLILTDGVSSKPASNDYEDYEGRSFEVMSFDDKTNDAEETSLDGSSGSSLDYLESLEHPLVPHQETPPAEVPSSSDSDSSTVQPASQDEGIFDYYEEYDDQSNSESPAEDRSFEQNVAPFVRTRLVPLYTPPPPKNPQKQSTQGPQLNSNGNLRQRRPTNRPPSSPVPTIQPIPPQQIISIVPTPESRPSPVFQPVVVSKAINPVALIPSVQAGTPHRLVVELSQIEQSIKRRFKEVQDKIDQIDQRISNVVNTSINGLHKEYMANKEQVKTNQEQLATRITELSKRTSQKLQSARQERETLYSNSEILRQSMNSHKAHHEKELKGVALGAAQNFGLVHEEVTRLFNMVNRLSQIQGLES